MRSTRWLRRAAVVALLPAMAGCGTLRATIAAYDTDASGMPRSQRHLREALAHDDLAGFLAAKEDDALLRALDVGTARYYAGQYALSAAVLDSAALVADDRITERLSKDALSLVTSDLARPYEARRTERLFMSYYGMLAYARLDQWEDAAVEARRLGSLLLQYDGDRDAQERETHALMHYLSGVVFERAGEREEAKVAYRNARALLPSQVDSARAPLAPGMGEVLVVAERGFVAHRVTESVDVFLGNEDHERAPRRARREHDRDGPFARRDGDHDDDDGGYWLSIAMASLRRSPRWKGDVSIEVDSAVAGGSRISALVDDAAASDAQRERTSSVARAVARAAAKYAVSKAVKDKSETAGTLMNVSTALLERADVRSWHLLPQELVLVRVPLSAGDHRVRLTGCGEDGTAVDVGRVHVTAGQVTIVPVRLWHAPEGRVIASR